MKRTIAILAATALAALSTGCALLNGDFTGKRNLSFKSTILGNNFEWQSTIDGAYTRAATDSGLAADYQPSSTVTTTTKTTIQGK